MSPQKFLDVAVWKKAHEWVSSIYRLTETFPKHGMFGRTSQLRRAAVSAPANCAEGFKKLSRKNKVWYDNVAQGSLEVCRYNLIPAGDLQHSKTETTMEMLDELARTPALTSDF